MNKPILHVGLPKTASTFLQRHFFPHFSDRQYFVPDRRSWPNEFDWIYKINRPFDIAMAQLKLLESPPLISKNTKKWLSRGRSFLANINRPILVSAEGMCGVSYAPHKNNLFFAQFLKDLFGFSKIIFIFRNQADWCESIYRQLIFEGDRFKKFIKFETLFGLDNSQNFLVDIRSLDWSTLITNYRKLFGGQNVLSLPYEFLVADYRGFLNRIMEFIGQSFELSTDLGKTRENVSAGDVYYRRWYGERYLPFPLARALKSKRLAYFSRCADWPIINKLNEMKQFAGIDEETKLYIKNALRSTNQELSHLLKIDLSEYQYY
ncbi:MAG: sulfotransferase [Planctomycetota bacterium]